MSEPFRASSLLLTLLAGTFVQVLGAQVTNPGSPTPNQPSALPAENPRPRKGRRDTGPPQPAQFDEQHRPITAGGFVKSGPVIFEDIRRRPA